MKVLMTPHVDDFKDQESGIRRVIEAYFAYLPDYGIELVKPEYTYDLRAVHAGMTGRECDVAHLHGMYWTADYVAPGWEYHANELIVKALRNALQVTVPSPWVAESLQRDMRFSPHVVPHGIEWTAWEPEKHEGYILWNKNRNKDVCDPTPAIELARVRSQTELVTTFLPYGMSEKLPNVRGVGLLEHNVMKKFIQRAMIYLSTTKETFGIGVLEAMAAGVPILAFDWGGNRDLVQHGVNGYLARPNDIQDLAEGLDYCMRYRSVLGDNAREMSKQWSWPRAVEQVANVYRLAMASDPHAGTVSVIIPCYNYAHLLERTVTSVLKQTLPPAEIIIVDDGSTDNTADVGRALADQHASVRYIHKTNGGVATARNAGISATQSEYICCIDADDQIEPKFLEACVTALNEDRSLGIAYTGLMMLREDGKRALSEWPTQPDYDKQLLARSPEDHKGANQIPTCNVFRREAWERTGGYKQRYAPLGAGAEDGEFWARIMSIGYGARKVSDAGLFLYDLGGRVSKPFADGSIEKELLEPQWLGMHPWAVNGEHPLASRATPKKMSHPVRQYDQPDVSIIIPVGPGHEKEVENALDSLEAQTFRRWEVIVSMDTGESLPERLLTAYPYINWVDTGGDGNGGGRGAGHARNLGARFARAPFLVFLDADDSLAPTFLERCIANWRENETIGYTDYYTKTFIPEEGLSEYLAEYKEDDFVSYVSQTQELVLHGRSADYDCARAQAQPSDTDFYHWCVVTSFIPKAWHDKIGGFDESMETFEDAHYHWKMARYGYCYTRIEEPLFVYRQHKGHRRALATFHTEEGKKIARSMIDYSRETLERIETVACKKCPGGKTPSRINVYQEINNVAQKEAAMVADNEMVMAEYTSTNIGNHHVVGAATGIRYGYRGGAAGTEFLVHKNDIAAQPHLFREKKAGVVAPVEEPVPVVAPPAPVVSVESAVEEPTVDSVDVDNGVPGYIAPPVTDTPAVPTTPTVPREATGPQPAVVKSAKTVVGGAVTAGKKPNTYVPPTIATADEEIDLEAIPGISTPVAKELRARGLITKARISAAGLEGLQEISGIGETRAEAIMSALAIDARESIV